MNRNLFIPAVAIVMLLTGNHSKAVTRTSVSSGVWNNTTSWIPTGVPSETDDIIISANHTITVNKNSQARNITVNENGRLIVSGNKNLNVTGNFSVNGIADIDGGNVKLLNSGSQFNLGPVSQFTWSPGNNTSSGATLFTNGIENFNAGSTLIIKKWFDYSVPLAENITGNFGNLVINSPGGTNSIVEWNQKNFFESHSIEGTLTIDQGWVTLDKSGQISSTTIGNIVLTSVNSTFIGHSTTHPSAFSIYTGSVTNNGGKFFGLNDGNGNLNMFVSGNFNNSGNIKLINNSGVSGVSNGNVVFKVDGDFIQSSGDTRLIYNISTTNSGTFSATIRNIFLTGGIFMGQTGCHTGGRINVLNVTKDFTISFSNETDKFRGNGISSIGSSVSNAGLAINVGGNLYIGGSDTPEFTSSASSGDELINVNGDMIVNGCNINFNNGSGAVSHSTKLIVNGNFNLQTGKICLSRNAGTLIAEMKKDLVITSGQMTLKGNNGKASLDIRGSLIHENGILEHHSNTNKATSDLVEINIRKNFRQQGGKINFDDNETGAEHTININGDSCIFTGDGIITRAGAGTSSSFGKINFDKPGKIFYERKNNLHRIEQVIQEVRQNCELVIKKGSVCVASHSTNNFHQFRIHTGAKLSVQEGTFLSNGLNNYCRILVDSAAVITLSNQEGLSGKSNSVFSPGVTFTLHRESIIEYAGEKNQIVSGSDKAESKYGILKINLRERKTQALIGENVFVRGRLELAEGSVKLNNHMLTIENGNPDGIRRTNGYIESDSDAAYSQNSLCWKNMTKGIHEFPFGRSSLIYLPVKFNLTDGEGNEVRVSTRRTYKNNLPYPANTISVVQESNSMETKAVDRWWSVIAPGTVGEITFTYCDDENTLKQQPDASSLCALQWNGTSWNRMLPSSLGGNNHIRTLTLSNIQDGSQYVIVSNQKLRLFELKLFEAKKNKDAVVLSWETINEAAAPEYVVEKSPDGIHFEEIGTFESNTTSDNLSSYNFIDEVLPEGISYYRLKYTNNNITSYSKIRSVSVNENTAPGAVKINSVSPNPFSSTVKIEYTDIDEQAMLEIIDSEGKRVINMPVQSNGYDRGYTMLNLEYLKKGIYFVNIISKGKRDTVKIIKNE